jgi:hypothetical protein
MLIWHSEKFDKINGILSVFSFSVELAAFDALRDCTSSKLQLLHWVPEQRVWNKKLGLAFVLPWRPCRQASPQKHACGTRLVANRPIMRNWTNNILNIFTFLNGFFSKLYSIKKPNWETQLSDHITHLQDGIQQYTKTSYTYATCSWNFLGLLMLGLWPII